MINFYILQYVNGNSICQRAMGGTGVVYHLYMYILYTENLQAMLLYEWHIT